MQVKFLFILVMLCTQSLAQKGIVFLWQKGNIAAKTSPEKALKYYLEAFELAKKQNNFSWQSNVLTDISGAYFGLGDYQKGAESCELGLKIIHTNDIKVDSIRFKLHSALAANYKTLYRVSDAQKNYAVANNIIEANPKLEDQIPLYAAYHFSNQGALWLKLCDSQKAKLFYEKALEISRKMPKKADFALILSNLSKFYYLGENIKEGISLQKNAIDFYKKSHEYSKIELAKMYIMLGLFYTKNQEFPKAKNSFALCKNLCFLEKKLTESQHYYNSANLEIITVEIRQQQLKTAKKYLDKLNLSKLSPSLKYDYWKIYGEYYFATQNFTQSLLCFSKALKEIKQNLSSNEFDDIKVFEIQKEISKAFFEKYNQTNNVSDIENSLSALQECIKLGTKIRQNFDNIESKLFFTDKYYAIYKEALNHTFILYQKTKKKVYLESAFALAEESKSVILLDKQAMKVQFRNGTSDSLLLKLTINQNYLSYLKNQVEHDQIAINKYSLIVNQALEKIKYINQSFSESFQKKALVEISKTQKLLPEKTIYINYIIYQNQLFVLAANKQNLYFQKVDFKAKEYDNNLESLIHSLTLPPSIYEGFSANKSCEYFYDLLIRNTFPDMNNYNRLIINPDNSFYDVSFDILRNKNDGKFLIETKAITYTNNLESTIKPSSKTHKISEKWDVFLPMNDSTKVLEAGLQPLKYSTAEAKGIISDLFINRKASKQVFLSKLQSDSNKVVMIATHAKSENEDPYLIFDGQDSIDSKLYASELQFIKTKAPLVILSACETNTGKTMGGLGVLSFSKSLELSGCKAVVGSFWEVDDESLSILSSLFYQNLMAGMDKDIALQKAKLSYLKTETGVKNDLPFYWAHLQIIGNNQAIVSKLDPFTVFVFITFSLISLSLIYHFFIKNAFLEKSES